MTNLAIGDVIIDNLGRAGIVFSVERRPTVEWINQQEDVRMSRAAGPWWNVLPLSGGAVIMPDDLGSFNRRANADDLLQLFDAQQTDHAGRATLLELMAQLRKASKKRSNNSLKPNPLRGSA